MSTQQLRIRLKGFDFKSLDRSAQQIVETAERTGALVAGPIPLPTRIDRFTILRKGSNHRDAGEQVEVRIHKRVIDMLDPTPTTLEALMQLNLPGGVDVEIVVRGPVGVGRARSAATSRHGAATRQPGRIQYRAPQELVSDPLGGDNADGDQATAREDVVGRATSHDRLLDWLSAWGNGSWNSFVSACYTLGLDRESRAREARRILRRLRLLGHLETNQPGTKWAVTRAGLVGVRPGGADSDRVAFVLCGARDQRLLRTLQEIAPMRRIPQPQTDGPAAIVIDGHADELREKLDATSCAGQIEVYDNAALSLAKALPPIEQWAATLSALPNLSPHMFECRRLEADSWVEGPFTGRSGLYELWPARPSETTIGTRPTYSALYDARAARWLRGDWYGLRFIARALEGRRGKVNLDVHARRLLVPIGWRWPEPYERVLVLASGRLPTLASEKGGSYVVYRDISVELVQAVITKLHLDWDDRPHA